MSGQETSALLRLAGRQHGLFTLGDAQSCGFTRPAIRRRLSSGTWEEVAPRVYRIVAALPIDWRQSVLALTIASRGLASGESAAALFGLLPVPARHEIVVGRRPHLRLEATIRTTSALATIDRTQVGCIPVTTPARTIIDLAARLPGPVFEVLLDTAIVQRLVTPQRLRARAVALSTPRRHGCTLVLSALEQLHPELALARNAWEARVLRHVRALGLPAPRCNSPVRIGGRRRFLDLAWPECKVVVELDGFVPHSNRRAFDDDRVRQNHLVDAGWLVFRLTTTALERDLVAAFAPVTRALGVDQARNGTPSVTKRA